MKYQQHMNFSYLILRSLFTHTRVIIRGLQKTKTTENN